MAVTRKGGCPVTLGQKIKAARQERGMTQKELVGDYITRNMLSKIENDSATPSVRTLSYLAQALGVPSGYFLSGAPISDGSVPDGLDGARSAFREGRWSDCLAALEEDKLAGTSDEGYLLHARAGLQAARAALEQGDWAAAREDGSLRRQLLATRHADDPMDAFCRLAQSLGYAIYLGDLFAAGQEYSDNQCKSTNGGNPRPYDSFDDTLEFFLCELEQSSLPAE